MDVFSIKTAKILFWVGLGLLIPGLIIFFWGESFLNFDEQIKSDKIGQFGDFVGGLIGSLWAAAGFILFYVALKEQINSYNLQKVEFESTKNLLKQQKFETTYFNMLNLLINIVGTMKRNDSSLNSNNSKDCFMFYYDELEKHIINSDNLQDVLMNKGNPRQIDIQEGFIKFYDKYKNELEKYFNNTYNILKFIHKHQLPDSKFYFNYLRAQFNSNELILMFHYALSEKSNENLKEYIESGEFFRYLDKDNRLVKDFLDFYLPIAYEQTYSKK
ncbi:putative phage abortive infection protein [Namhaeicola litoreus]|uniref:Phage abortive infection protein n=1 Tax=Namhaeicola litoreus TaxID=1052145 RepID=A0ABW3XY45_9FLAO